MCGRYTLTLTKDGLRAQIPTIGSFGMPWKPRYNLAPTNIVPAIISEEPTTLHGLRWGLIPSWAKDAAIGQKLINARGETLGEKPSFRLLFKRRRCLIPADGFYEWRSVGRRKQPIYIRLHESRLFTFAGLWDEWKNATGETVRSCSIITTNANELIQKFHHRMPVIIRTESRPIWIDPKITDTNGLMDLIKPYPFEKMEAYPVSPTVNKPENDSPECIDPLPDLHI